MYSSFGIPTTAAVTGSDIEYRINCSTGALPLKPSCANTFIAITPIFLRLATGRARDSKLWGCFSPSPLIPLA
jgi:hypothetical protein